MAERFGAPLSFVPKIQNVTKQYFKMFPNVSNYGTTVTTVYTLTVFSYARPNQSLQFEW